MRRRASRMIALLTRPIATGRALCMTPRCLLGLALLVPAGSPAQAAPADDAVAEVRQLADPSFRVRERAAERLRRLGRLAKLALLDGRGHPDPEVRSRCERLLPAAMADDRRARLDAFLADPDGRREHDLPGWERFRRAVGSDPAARELFVRMFRADGELMEAAEREPERVSGQFFGLCLQAQQRPVELGRAALMLFVASRPDVRSDFQGWNPVYNFLHQDAVRTGVAGPLGAPLRRLIVSFLEPRTDTAAVQQVFQVATQYRLTEFLPYAERVARDNRQTPYGRALAALVLARLGGPANSPSLEVLLDEATPVGPFQWNGVRGTTELRDVALAGLVSLNGLSARDFGFPALQRVPNPGLQSPYYLGFVDDAQRAAAHRRWKDLATTKPAGARP
jgi:hypothetical protein